jgi:ketopantoate reductase
MRIAVVEAGAIGACFGAMLAEAGCEVSLIARGAHLDAIRANGLTTGRFLVRLVEETVAVGHAEGIALPPDQVERTMALIAGLPEGMHGSMRDDLERGMRLELPWLCGRVAELGRKHGLATPVNDTVVLGLKLHSDGRS